MKPPLCPNNKCGSVHTKAISALFGEDPTTLQRNVYVVFQCKGCNEIFMRRLVQEVQP